MTRIQTRTRWKGLTLWIVGLAGTLAATAASIASLYPTAEKVHTYAAAVGSGALYAINGKVEGIDSLGGVVQDEFGFLAAFLFPLLGIALIAGSTRREEEEGRLELLLSARIGRRSPVLAALLVAAGTIAVTTIGCAAAVGAWGVPVSSSALYAASLGALAFAFAGLSALLAQVSRHSNGVYFGGFAALATAYVLRGVGDVTGSPISWLSPLGWQEKTAPTGEQRWWALAIPLAVGAALGALAVRLAGRRDHGSALLGGAAGPDHARGPLLRPAGLAIRIHRQSVLGWLFGALVLAVMMGALAQQLIDAMTGNPALAEAVGAGGGHPVEGTFAMTHLYIAIIASGYVVQAVGGLRREETHGRVETPLAGRVSRAHWLAAHGGVILAGLIVIVLVSSLTYAVTTAWSMSDASQIRRLTWAGLAYLPAELVFTGLALAMYGTRARAFPLTWAAYAAVAFIAFLGPGLKLPGWALDLAPTTHVGNPPQDSVEGTALTVLTAIALALGAIGFIGFRHRNIPQT